MARQPMISFLELSPNNRRGKVLQLLGYDPFTRDPVEREIADRIIAHAADVAEKTMRDYVATILVLKS